MRSRSPGRVELGPGAVRLAEWLAVGGVGAALAILAHRVVGAVEGFGDAVLASFAALAGWVLADLVSGVVHWWADRVASEETPLLGPHFVRPFREHHEDPSSICAHGFAATNGNTCMVVLPFLAAWLALASGGPTGTLAASAGFLGLALGSCLTNQIHQWAHAPRVPGPVAPLQRVRLFLTPAHHAQHHRAPFARCYCITSGWLDAALDGLGVFGALERALGRPSGPTVDRAHPDRAAS